MQVRLFTDIDDTLMSTARKAPEAQRATVGAVDTSGAPSSYQSTKQKALWDLLVKGANSVVPTSARSPASLARMQLPMTDGAIADFGATILLPDGSVDRAWDERMLANVCGRPDEELLTALKAYVQKRAKVEVKVEERRTASGVLAFVNFRGAPGSSDRIRKCAEAVIGERDLYGEYYLHISDRDLTVLPSFVTKERAAAYIVADRGWGDDLLLGAGDSLADCPFMGRMDFALLPTASRAFSALYADVRRRGELPLNPPRDELTR